MKKLIYLLFATVLFCSCEKDELFEQPVQGGVASGDLPEVIYATVADDDSVAQTRTFVDGKDVKWHSGESISYYAGTYGNVKYTMKEDQPDGTVSAEFVKDGDAKYAFGEGAYGTPTFPLAVYPYDENQRAAYSQGGYGILVKFAKEQTYAPNSFGKGANIMVAKGSSNDDGNLHFQHACGYLVIKLYGEDTKVSNITLTALGEGVKISGEATLRVTQKKTVAFNGFNKEATYNTVTLDCSNGGQGVALGADAEHATEFWFALPPVTITGGLEITVTDTEGYTFTKQTTKDIEITRRDIQPMAALEFIPHLELTPNRFFYTRSDGKTELVKFYEGVKGEPFIADYKDWDENDNLIVDAKIKKHYYDEKIGKFVIECDAPIIAIKDYAFNEYKVDDVLIGNYSEPENVTDITSVTFPKSLTTIGKFAFAGTALRELTIPGNVTQVGYYAFWECRSLEGVSILEGDQPLMVVVENLSTARGPFAFSPLRYIYINRAIDYRSYDIYEDKIYNWYDQSYQNVRQGLFSLGTDDDEKTNYPVTVDDITVEFGPNQSTIYPYMFAYRNIKSITIPSQVTLIGKNAFESCNDLESVTIQAPQATIDDNAFWFCENLNTADISVNKIGLGSFYGCSKLESVTIRGTVNEIENDAFYNCKGLKSLTFEPGSTTLTLGYQTYGTNDQSPFYDCPLETLNWNRKISYTLANAGTVDAVNEGLFAGKENLTNVTIGEQVQTIPPYTFAGSGMTSITIPSNVGSIGDYAYYNSDNLTSVNVPSTVATIGLGAFYDCDGLTSATINSSTLGSNMFDGCDKLATVTIGGTLDAINVDAFTGCSKLSTLNISGSVGSISDHAFDTFPLTSLNISGHVGTIGAQAFNDNDKMTSFIVTGSVGTIGASAFEDSDKLATVNITGTVDRVCQYAFSDCDAVETLAIRANTVEAYAYEDMDGLKTATLYGATVGDGVLRYCDNLEELIIDGGVNSIGNDAFYDCPRLARVTFKGSTTNLRLGYQPGTNDRGPFYGSPLTYINLNRQIDYIYDNLDATDEGVFVNANTTTPATVVLGENVKAIHNWMFYGVPISSLTIPAGINAIGYEAFGNNSRLTQVTCQGSTPATLDSFPFATTSLGAIYVPSDKVDLYKASWYQYSPYIRGK